jgi:hypothetical protein
MHSKLSYASFLAPGDSLEVQNTPFIQFIESRDVELQLLGRSSDGPAGLLP